MSSSNKKTLYGAIELGGTKVNCLVGTGDVDIVAEQQFRTRDPLSTLQECCEFFRAYMPLECLGIGSFGPLNLNRTDGNYGRLELTPKEGWSHFPLKGYVSEHLGCDVVIDTDVNVAALAEAKLGHGKGLDAFIYITVGTGIGGSAFVQSSPLHGLSHPEMGHIQVMRDKADSEFQSCCPYHENCIEGLASGLAVMKRWGKKLDELPQDHPGWLLQSNYLAQFFHSLVHAYSPQRIIVGGGAANEKILTLIRQDLHLLLNGYVYALREAESLEDYICLPSLGSRAGPLGALILAQTS